LVILVLTSGFAAIALLALSVLYSTTTSVVVVAATTGGRCSEGGANVWTAKIHDQPMPMPAAAASPQWQ